MTQNRLLVKPQRNSDLSGGGVYTGRPATTFTQHAGKDEQICTGQIMAMGPGKRHKKTGALLPMDVEVGQHVAFSDTCHRATGDDDLIYLTTDDVMLVSDEPINHCEVMY